MTYLFVCFELELEKSIRKQFSFLANALSIKNKQELKSVSASIPKNTLFLVHFKGKSSARDDLILSLRDEFPQGKVICLADGKTVHDLKEHQLTPAGGDAYLDIKISETEFLQVVANFQNEFEIDDEDLPPDVSEVTKTTIEPALEEFRNDPVSRSIDATFSSIIKLPEKQAAWQSAETLTQIQNKIPEDVGEDMSNKDQELSLDDMGELELGDDQPDTEAPSEDGIELSLGGDELDLGDDFSIENNVSSSLQADSGTKVIENIDELDFDLGEDKNTSLSITKIEGLDGIDGLEDLNLSEDVSLSANLSLDDNSLDFEEIPSERGDLSMDAQEKLKEIDEIMVKDKTQSSLTIPASGGAGSLLDDLSLDEPLVSDDLNFDNLNFGGEDDEPTRVKSFKSEDLNELEEKPKKKRKENRDKEMGQDLRELSGAYSGELERTGATISNLRADREELLTRIQKLEEEKLLQNRQMLSMRAELDEKKIELTIVRKKQNEEISMLKDRLNLFDEKRLILEEKNKYLAQELDKASQKNKIDVRKVQNRERELEQKLELLKSDAENQIRNRDMKILELKRKLDGMEFDMESISQQEKRSVESRFELEDKLDKAIKTLRGAITVLEDESQRGNALEVLKKNIDM